MVNVIEDTAMVNQINDSAHVLPATTDSRLKAQNKKQEEALVEDKLHAETEDVNLSDASKQLDALKASLKDVPEVNQARVEHFKAEIAAGTYQVHSDKIAQKMLEDMQPA